MKTIFTTTIFCLCFLMSQAQVIDPNAFVTTWQTDNVGTSNSSSITIPTNSNLNYNYQVDWESDGIWDETGLTGSITHNYLNPGSYQVSIRGTFPHIFFANQGDKQKLLSIDQWGTIAWGSMQAAFRGCSNMTHAATDTPDLTAVTNMTSMFRDASAFNGDISTWNTENVSHMNYMFAYASSFNGDISDWNTANVSTMDHMFFNASSFSSDLSDWDMSNVTSVDYMLTNSGMNTNDYDNTLFGWASQNLQSNLTFRAASVHYCNAETERQSLIDNFSWTIFGDSKECLPFISTWKTNNPGTSSATSITIPTAGNFYNYDIDWESDGVWDVIGATGSQTHDYMTAGTYQVSIRGDFPRIRFNNAGDRRKIISIDQWGNIAWKSMYAAFMGCSNMESTATDAPYLRSVTNMSNMFFHADIFNGDLSNWDVSSVTTMSRMFIFAFSFNGDLSAWDVSAVTYMGEMFWSATSFNSDLSAWDVSSVTYMAYMFFNAQSFNSDLSKWDVSAATNMIEMFRLASSFNQNLGAWDMSNVNNVTGIFSDTDLDIANYDSTLIGWSSQTLKPNKVFGANGRKYCNAEVERQSIIDNFAWTFVGDSQAADCPYLRIASGDLNQCKQIGQQVVDGTGGADNWIHFTDEFGEVVASIENTENLGNVQVSFYTHPDGERMDTKQMNYLGRNISIEVDNQPANLIKVRLYFLESEYTALQNSANTAVPNSVSIADLNISKYSLSACTNSYADAGINPVLSPNLKQGLGLNGFFLETEVSSFSQFFIHEANAGNPLPVELSSFKGEVQKEGNYLAWKTYSETNNEGFYIERSENALDFESIGFVAGNGNSTEGSTYKFLDERPTTSLSYYRLKQVDFDGQFQYSEIISLKRAEVNQSISIYPNPARNQLNFNHFFSGTYSIVNVLGQVMQEGNLADSRQINIASLPKGQYVLQLIGNNSEASQTIFIRE